MTAGGPAGSSADADRPGALRDGRGDAGTGGRGDAAFWDEEFRRAGHVWGDEPGELAAVAIDRLRTLRAARPHDATIEYRRAGLRDLGRDRARTRDDQAAGDPLDGLPERFDAVYCANLWQVLGPDDRAALAMVVGDRLAAGGLLLLSTLSTSDPQHGGRGRPVAGDAGSFVERTYVHLSSREELAAAFAYLDVERLDEIAYREERPGGEPHRHVSWVLVGRAG